MEQLRENGPKADGVGTRKWSVLSREPCRRTCCRGCRSPPPLPQAPRLHPHHRLRPSEAGKIKEEISSLPTSTVVDDNDEAEALGKAEDEVVATDTSDLEGTPTETLLDVGKEISDPFDLDALLPSTSKR